MDDNQKITYFAETNFHNQKLRFGIKKIDRRKHMYVVGKTGMGKTTLLEKIATGFKVTTVMEMENEFGRHFVYQISLA